MRNDKQLCKKIKALYRSGYSITEIAETVGLRKGTVLVITHG